MDLSGLIVPGNLDPETAVSLIEPAKNVTNLAKKTLSDLRAIAIGQKDESED